MRLNKPFATAGASIAMLLNAACATGPYGAGYGQPYGGQPGLIGGPVGTYGRYEPAGCRQYYNLLSRSQQSQGESAIADAIGRVGGALITGNGRATDSAIQRGTGNITRGMQRDVAVDRQIALAAETCNTQRAANPCISQMTSTNTIYTDSDRGPRTRGRETTSTRCEGISVAPQGSSLTPPVPAYRGGAWQGPADSAPTYRLIEPSERCLSGEQRSRVIIRGQESLACVAPAPGG